MEVVYLLFLPVYGNVVPPQMPCQLTSHLQPRSSVVLPIFTGVELQQSTFLLQHGEMYFLWPEEELCDTHIRSGRTWLTLLADFTEICVPGPAATNILCFLMASTCRFPSELFYLKNSKLSKEQGKRSKEKRECSTVIKANEELTWAVKWLITKQFQKKDLWSYSELKNDFFLKDEIKLC